MSVSSFKRRKSSVNQSEDDGKMIRNMICTQQHNQLYTKELKTLKSNSIKPANFHIPLDALPNTILSKVCSNLPTRDLLSLLYLGQQFATIIRPFLYRCINMIDIQEDEDELIIQKHVCHFKDEALEKQDWFITTDESLISSPKNLLKFIHTVLMNNAYGKLIKRIKIDSPLKPSPWLRCRNNVKTQSNVWRLRLDEILTEEEMHYISHTLPFVTNDLVLYDCLKKLFQYTPNLESLVVPQFPLPEVAKLIPNLSSLKQITLMIHENDSFQELPLKNLKNLNHLTLKFQENTEVLLQKLSLNLYESNILSQIKILELKYDKTDFNHLSKATWFAFFDKLPDSCVYVSLKSLKLKDCYFGDSQATFINHLIDVIPIWQLECLYLQIYEYSHKMIRHTEDLLNTENYKNTVIQLLKPFLKNLKTLTVKPTKNCMYCQYNSVVEFLKCYHGLEYLSLTINTLNKENYLELLSILRNYKCLNQITLFDDFINSKLENNMKNWFVFQNLCKFDVFKDYEVEYMRQDRIALFEAYRMESFNSFNKKQMNLLILFWKTFMLDFRLDQLFVRTSHVKKLKLFGYNFRVIPNNHVIQMYISNDIGYKDLMFYC